MDRKTKNRLIQAARKISLGWKPRLEAKSECKVDKALYKCSKCGTLVYEGTSPVTFVKYEEQYSKFKVVMERFDLDHIEPVVPTDGSDHDWNVYYSRLFCDKVNYRGLCSTCHKAKSRFENTQRIINKSNRRK